jgi:ketosteroid isomerase-like protein
VGYTQAVNAVYEAFGRGDIPLILDRLDPDVRWESWAENSAQTADVPWVLPRTGRDGVAEFFAEVARLAINEFAVLDRADGDARRRSSTGQALRRTSDRGKQRVRTMKAASARALSAHSSNTRILGETLVSARAAPVESTLRVDKIVKR